MKPQILEYEGTWEELALHEPEFRGRKLRLTVLPGDGNSAAPARRSTRAPSARELLKLPLKERDRILAAQAAKAETFYRNNPELTDFAAFGEEDFFDETP